MLVLFYSNNFLKSILLLKFKPFFPLLNQNNVIENSGLNDEIEEIISNENSLINSYVDNVLLSFNNSLVDFKNMKEKRY